MYYNNLSPIEHVVSLLPTAKPNGKGWMACCPAHEDRSPSLSINEGDDGRVLLKCFAGCGNDAITDALGLETKDLFVPRDSRSLTPHTNGKLTSKPKSASKAKSVRFATPDTAVSSLMTKNGKPAGQWIYHDVSGKPVVLVLRFNRSDGSKYFQPVSLHLDGGWYKKAPATPRPLYGLPDLAPASVVYVCEGEKAADAARSIGLITTTSIGGSQAPELTDWTPLVGKIVIILCDNDEAGRKYAETIAGILHHLGTSTIIKIVELPGLPPKGDVVEWIEAHGDAAEPEAMGQELERLVAACPVQTLGVATTGQVMSTSANSVDSVNCVYSIQEWEHPVPLSSDSVDACPVDVLPKWARDECRQLATFTQTPVDMSVGMWLSACGVALQKKFVVEPRRGWIEPVNIYLLCAMDPANRKSAVVSAIAKPLKEYEKRQAELQAPMMRSARSAFEIRAKRRLELINSAAKAPLGNDRDAILHEVQLVDEEIAANPVPSDPRLLVDDITPENLGTLMCQNQGRMGVLTAEGDLFDIMCGRYSAKGKANLGIFLKSHCGDDLLVDRGSRPPERVESPALSLGFCVQPDVQRELIQQKILRGRGLLARMLFMNPKSLIGRREIEPDEIDQHVQDNYLACMSQMLELPAEKNELGNFVPERWSLSPDAYYDFSGFRSETEDALGEFGALAAITDWGGKLPGAVARLAGLLHAAEHIERPKVPAIISGETMNNAILLGRYFISHATASFRIMGRDESLVLAEHIKKAIEKHSLARFTQRDLHQLVRRRVQSPDDLTAPLSLLEDHNFIRPIPQNISVPRAGRKPSPEYETNPRMIGNLSGAI